MSNNCNVVLVTGSTGLIGNALKKIVEDERRNGNVQSYNETWVFVSTKDANLCDKQQTDQLFMKYKPTHVINLAADVGGLFHNMAYKIDFMTKNLSINMNVLEASFNHKVKKVVSCLSTCVFPDDTTFPIDETALHKGPPHESNYGFAYAKRMIDIANRAYNEQHGCMFTSIVPCNIFGPHDNFNIHASHVYAAIVRRMHDAMERGDGVFTVMGTGKPLRQFIYSLDLAKLLLWVFRDYNSVEPIILSVNEEDEVSIKEMAETIKKAMNYKGELVYDTSKPDGQFKKTVSNKKLRKNLPNFKFTNFEDATKETVEWYMNNKHIARL